MTTEAKIINFDDSPTHLYRHFDEDGVLLYVGVSYNAMMRTYQHVDKEWFCAIKTITVEKFQTRTEAIVAEKDAIKKEAPKYNFIYSYNEDSSTSKESSSYYLDSDIIAWLAGSAQKEGRSASGYLNYLLRKIKEGKKLPYNGSRQ